MGVAGYSDKAGVECHVTVLRIDQSSPRQCSLLPDRILERWRYWRSCAQWSGTANDSVAGHDCVVRVQQMCIADVSIQWSARSLHTITPHKTALDRRKFISSARHFGIIPSVWPHTTESHNYVPILLIAEYNNNNNNNNTAIYNTSKSLQGRSHICLNYTVSGKKVNH